MHPLNVLGLEADGLQRSLALLTEIHLRFTAKANETAHPSYLDQWCAENARRAVIALLNLTEYQSGYLHLDGLELTRTDRITGEKVAHELSGDVNSDCEPVPCVWGKVPNRG